MPFLRAYPDLPKNLLLRERKLSFMSIGNELSYDVAAAVLSRKEENPARTEELLAVLVNFHMALQPLMKQARQRRRLATTNNAQAGGAAATTASSASNSVGN
jgi:hypothetical protein